MEFNLTAPCGNCPFRTDVTPYLRTDRVREICDGITTQQKSFACHKTTKSINGRKSIERHCAGAMIMLEKMKRPNQMMRIAERLGSYDHTKLKMDSPVYKSATAMIAAYHATNLTTEKL